MPHSSSGRTSDSHSEDQQFDPVMRYKVSSKWYRHTAVRQYHTGHSPLKSGRQVSFTCQIAEVE